MSTSDFYFFISEPCIADSHSSCAGIDSLMVFILHWPFRDVAESTWVCYPRPSPGRGEL